MRLKKGDKVKILLGKDRGKEGTVEYVMGKEKRVFVSGANMYKRHVKKMPASRGGQNMEGGIVDIPKSLDVSNIGLICPNCKKVTRVGYKKVGNGKLRVCKKCKKDIKEGIKT